MSGFLILSRLPADIQAVDNQSILSVHSLTHNKQCSEISLEYRRFILLVNDNNNSETIRPEAKQRMI